jgi:beta-glucanase (GH16 family)
MHGTAGGRTRALALGAALVLASQEGVTAKTSYATKSGILPWVDPATPDDYQTYISSRGDTWELTMSDEFNTPNRSFEPGEDHMWTSIDKPDGVNAALEVYSHNMTSTECDDDDNCYFYIEAMEDDINVTVWNDYITPPGYQDVSFYYRAGMVQSWNKFCFQGGMIETRVQLPGAVSASSGNPDIESGEESVQTTTIGYYPTWPGIWMMGNLGRAIFSASTSRMWPYSYNECNETIFESQNQRISACDDDPGSGMNPNQGRGAPEIDILEGGGTAISSSIQLGPGMPEDFRMIADNTSYSCMYTYDCTTEGANNVDVPTAYYEELRGYKSWYQGLRYSSNNFCASDSSEVQSYTTVKASLDAGITDNACTLALCPSSFDVHSDLSLIDGSSTDHWGINSNGTCFPKKNAYAGAFLCSPGNTDERCSSSSGSSDATATFAYQMDAISSNWPIHIGAYTSWLVYQLEWVTGDEGYVRWMLAGAPIFEVPADAIVNPPQDKGQTNPKKIMIEEPMYIIFNVALSSTWGTTPPNAGSACRGDGTDATANAICDDFPMKMKIDYIRLYQDTSNGTAMAIGCDPETHPTAQWITDHIDEYTDTDNPWTEVSGKGFCTTDDDCTITKDSGTSVTTGSCKSNRCKCSATSWKGPRCTTATSAADSTGSGSGDIFSDGSYGPPMYASLSVSGVTVLFTFVAVYASVLAVRKSDEELRKQILLQQQQQQQKNLGALSAASASDVGLKPPNSNYSTNFV